MTVRKVLVLVAVFISASASIAAEGQQGAGPTASTAAREKASLFPQNTSKNPYATLFTESTIAGRRGVAPQTEAQLVKPKVVCGMLVVPVDSSVDPNMRKSPPDRDNTTYAIRVVKPPICNPE